MIDTNYHPLNTDGREIHDQWEYRRFECILADNQMGNWLGYARVGDYVDDVRDITVHGGVTYGPDEHAFVGFDCGHAFDRSENEDGEALSSKLGTSLSAMYEKDDPMTTVWKPDDVRREIEAMVDSVYGNE